MILSRLLPALMAAGLLAACASTPSTPPPGGGLDRVSPVRGAEINTRLGFGYLERGQLQIAMEKLQLALQHDPNHVPAHVALGIIYEQIGDDQMASRHFRQASRLAPGDGGTQNSFAVFLCRQGQFAEAERHFMAAVRDPFYSTPAVAWTNAGACARRSGDLDLAERHLRRALDLDAHFPDALFHLADIFYQQGDPFRARAFLQRFESAANPEPGALLLGYMIESRLNNRDDANQYASRLERQFPDSPEVRELSRRRQQYD